MNKGRYDQRGVTKNYKECDGACLTGQWAASPVAGCSSRGVAWLVRGRRFAGVGAKCAAWREIAGERGAGCVGEACRKRVVGKMDGNRLLREGVGCGSGGA